MKLMMLKGAFTVIGIMTVLSVSAGEQIDRIVEANPKGYVEIEHVNGKAEIKGWDKPQVQVKGTLGKLTERFVFERRGNEVLIKVKVKSSRKHSSRWGGDDEDQLVIFVPRQSRLNYTAVNADVLLSDVKEGLAQKRLTVILRPSSWLGACVLNRLMATLTPANFKVMWPFKRSTVTFAQTAPKAVKIDMKLSMAT